MPSGSRAAFGQTLPNEERERRHAKTDVLHLVRVLGYDRPHEPGSRHDLSELKEVTFGRGEKDEAVREYGTLTLRIADPRMSGQHAKLARVDARWVLTDLGSRNGSYVDGEKLREADVGDGSMIELGGSAFMLRAQPQGKDEDVGFKDLIAPLPDLVTFSTTFETSLAKLRRLAVSAQSIILHGETGTGKEVVARAVHVASGRSGAFVAVNCGALPPNLVESELFGHKKGAFSGATEDRVGLVGAANKGTLFLDEIGDLPLPTQVALLRVIQEKEVTPIGATRPVPVDLRVLAASHRDLEAEVTAGRFREDLWSRLAGYTAEIPALRDRREDLGILIAALLARHTQARGIRFTPEAGAALVQYHWPRNVRELEQVLASATVLAADGVIELSFLPRALQALGGAAPSSRTSRPSVPPSNVTAPRTALSPEDLQRRDELRAALTKHRGNIAAVGRELGVARMQVHRWLDRFEIDIADYRDRDE